MTRVVATSDTHLMMPEIPAADIFIHCGDLCQIGGEDEFRQGLAWMASLPHKHKIYVPGNHDRFTYDFQDTAWRMCRSAGVTMLVDTTADVCGLRIHGSPWTPLWGKTAAFMWKDWEDSAAHWRNLPRELDVLVTHGPPAGIYDNNVMGFPCGCPELLKGVRNAVPRVHLFGHIHPGAGGRRMDSQGIFFANVSYCIDRYADEPKMPPFVFNIGEGFFDY